MFIGLNLTLYRYLARLDDTMDEDNSWVHKDPFIAPTSQFSPLNAIDLVS